MRCATKWDVLELKTLWYNCGFLILIYQAHSFWILISNIITYSMKLIFYAEKDDVFLSIQTLYFLGPIFLACSLDFSCFITHSPQCAVQLGKWRLLFSTSVLGYQDAKQGVRQKLKECLPEFWTPHCKCLQGITGCL